MRSINRYSALLLALAIGMVVAVACGAAATATPRPVAAPTVAAPAAPTPTRAAVATPTAAPVATPTKAPVAAPTPTKAPVVAAKRKPTGELKIAVPTFGNERWRPNTMVGAEDTVGNVIFENLLTRHPQTGEHLGELAEKWEMREAGRVWEYRLRKGVQFHEGWGEMTAEDVRFSFEQMSMPGSLNARAFIFRKIKDYQTPDQYTIILNLKEPETMLQDETTTGYTSTNYVYPKKYITTVGDEAADRKPIGSDAFRLVKHVRGDRIEYEALEDHWRVTPAFKGMVILKVPEDATRMAMLRAGTVDILDIGIDFIKEMQAAGLKVLFIKEVTSMGMTLAGQWPGRPATYDPKVPWALPDEERARKVRLALQLAVDRKSIIDTVLGGLGDPNVAVTLFLPGKPWTPEHLKPRGYDPVQARKLMAEAGYTNCFEFTMNLVPWPGFGSYFPLLGEAVATQWEKELGCKIKRRLLDRAVFNKDFAERTYAGVALPWAAPIVGSEPWQTWRLISHSKGQAQLSGIEHPQLDAFFDQLGAEGDPVKRIAIMRKMAEWVYENIPRIEIGSTGTVFGVGPRVKDWPVIPSRWRLHNLEYINVGWAPPGQPVVPAK